MKMLELKKIQHNVKIGDVCGPIKANIVEDTIFLEDGQPIGFYVADMGKYDDKLCSIANLANSELLSDRVPKSTMNRVKMLGDGKYERIEQFSCILGSVAPKPHMRRAYPSRSSVHSVKSADNFVKAMLLLCQRSEQLIAKLTPNIYEQQKKIFEEHVPKKWRFGNLFTSSISNYNISAPFHRDAANIEGCVNVIIAKKHLAEGGNTTVPDYGATVNSCDNSMLVYPAWKNVHGVTPIEPLDPKGYRNSLVFYPLKAFYDIEE